MISVLNIGSLYWSSSLSLLSTERRGPCLIRLNIPQQSSTHHHLDHPHTFLWFYEFFTFLGWFRCTWWLPSTSTSLNSGFSWQGCGWRYQQYISIQKVLVTSMMTNGDIAQQSTKTSWEKPCRSGWHPPWLPSPFPNWWLHSRQKPGSTSVGTWYF